MTIAIIRSGFYETEILGNLFVLENEKILFQCKTLELPWRNNSSKNSCIPPGIYTAKFEYSNNFKEKLWELKKVPGRAEIKIHVANYVSQLRGCIAVGESHQNIDADSVPDIAGSRKTLEKLHKILEGLEKITVKIYGSPE